MTAELLQGRDLASQIREISRAEIESLGYRPKVVAIHNQDNPACGVYMRMQKNLFRKSGVEYEVVLIGEHTPEKEVRSLLATLNEDPTVQGITMHVPFPEGYDSDALSQLILPGKDIEGVHPHNIGMIAYGEHNPTPCAARAAVEIARTAHSSLAGMETCVVGHGTLVGKPIAFLLLQEKRTAPTPTICHVATKDLAFHTKRADLLFVAVGKASLIHKEMVISFKNLAVPRAFNFLFLWSYFTKRLPFLKHTSTSSSKSPKQFPRITVAQAPLPHAKVSPTPLSNTLKLTFERELISANPKFTPIGNHLEV